MEIKAALMQCIKALAPVSADVVPVDPIRDGDCGAPAPVLVKSIGNTESVSFDPPLVLDCTMVVGLDRWLKDSVQPAAREAFSLPVSKIIGSSYACRNVYNRPDGHLSQHALPMRSICRRLFLPTAERLMSHTAGVRLSAT